MATHNARTDITPEIAAAAAEKYGTYAAAAAALRCSPSTLGARAREGGHIYERRPQPRKPVDMERVMLCRANGWPREAICREFGISRTTLTSRIQQYLSAAAAAEPRRPLSVPVLEWHDLPRNGNRVDMTGVLMGDPHPDRPRY